MNFKCKNCGSVIKQKSAPVIPCDFCSFNEFIIISDDDLKKEIQEEIEHEKTAWTDNLDFDDSRPNDEY